MRLVFFSLRNFQRDGGGSVRMYGILNALAKEGNEVVFISNAKNYQNFDDSIKHIYIDYEVSPGKKALFQGLLSIIPAQIVYFIFKTLFNKIEYSLEKANAQKGRVYFFEYMDNSIAYVLKKKRLISSYINDLHGVTPIEFSYQMKTATNYRKYIYFFLKYKSSLWLDKKVFNYGDGFIYASKAMKGYYDRFNKNTNHQENYIIPYVLDQNIKNNKIDQTELKRLQNLFKLEKKDFIFFFAGGYKPTAGVDNLIEAFNKVSITQENVKLILIGTGPYRKKCEQLVDKFSIKDRVIFIDSIPYENLIAYQNLANVIVCPDKQNPYSNLIVHLKYFDSLISSKLVINGHFESVKEINKDEFLSLTFEPSNVVSLYLTMQKCVYEYEELCQKYKSSRDYVLDNLTYKNFVNEVIGK